MTRTRSAVTLTVLVVVFLIGTFVGVQLLTADAPSLAGSTEPTCEPRTIESGAKLGAGQITVNVYNASNRSGLATRTLRKLEDAGFRRGELGNAGDSVSNVDNVVIETKDKDSAAVRLVKKQFKGKVKVRKPQSETATGVRILLGKDFEDVKNKAPNKITAKNATEVCVLVEPEAPQQG